MTFREGPVDLTGVPPHARQPEAVDRVDSPALTRGGVDVAGFWAEVERRGTPLLERDDPESGTCVLTFVWRGGDETRSVMLIGNKLTDPRDSDAARMHRVPGTDIWHLSLRLDRRWRGTYAIAPAVHGEGATSGPRRELLELRRRRSLAASPDAAASVNAWYDHLGCQRPDRFNRGPVLGGLSVAAGPAAPDQGWWADPGTAPRDLETFEMSNELLAETWQVHVPPRARDEASRLLIVLDGDQWLEAGAGHVLDRLGESGDAPPVVTVLVPTPPELRRIEVYAHHDGLADLLTGALVDRMSERRDLTAGPVSIIGQSMGGLAALHAALRRPDVIGSVTAQSASLWWPHGSSPGATARLVAQADCLPARVALEVGTQEWVLRGPTEELRDVLRERDGVVTLREFVGGHDRVCWRDGFVTAAQNI